MLLTCPRCGSNFVLPGWVMRNSSEEILRCLHCSEPYFPVKPEIEPTKGIPHTRNRHISISTEELETMSVRQIADKHNWTYGQTRALVERMKRRSNP